MPTWNKVEEKYKNSKTVVEKINCEGKPEIAQKYGITGFPTILKFTTFGQVQFTGDRTEENITKFIDS
jgi:thioredoxin-like negative regulator of GroEL